MKTLLLIFIFSFYANAIDHSNTAKIYNTILTKIAKKSSVDVYCDSQEYREVLFQSKNINLVDTPYQADIILQTKSSSKFNKNSIIFTTKYYIFKNNSSVIGAFYWSKGRPQIIFSRQRLHKLNFTLSDELQKYVVEDF